MTTELAERFEYAGRAAALVKVLFSYSVGMRETSSVVSNKTAIAGSYMYVSDKSKQT